MKFFLGMFLLIFMFIVEVGCGLFFCWIIGNYCVFFCYCVYIIGVSVCGIFYYFFGRNDGMVNCWWFFINCC